MWLLTKGAAETGALERGDTAVSTENQPFNKLGDSVLSYGGRSLDIIGLRNGHH